MPTVDCNSATLYYEDHGTGDPIVFLHGIAAGLRFFEPQLRGLSDDYRIVAFDFRGHGRSENTALGHTLPQYARDVDAFLDALDLDDVVLVGWSMGALVSWDYVDQYGTDRLRATVNVDMEPCPFNQPGYEHGSYDLESHAEALVDLQTDYIGFLDDAAESLVKDAPSRDLETLLVDERSRTSPQTFATLFLEILRDYRDVLPEIDVPTLVCAGADESWRSVAAVESAAELVPDARFELFEESSHTLTVEEPERFNAVVREFVHSL